MQRKPLYLAASLAETARFVALAFLAEAAGALRSGDGLAVLFRYAAAPQLLFVAAFFFLWLDEARYSAYGILAFAGKILSIAAFLPLLVSLMGGDFSPLSGRMAPIAALCCLAIDLGVLFALIALKPFAAARQGGEGSGQAGGTGQSGGPGPGGGTGAGPRPETGPRGPEDIERVEG